MIIFFLAQPQKLCGNFFVSRPGCGECAHDSYDLDTYNPQPTSFSRTTEQTHDLQQRGKRTGSSSDLRPYGFWHHLPGSRPNTTEEGEGGRKVNRVPLVETEPKVNLPNQPPTPSTTQNDLKPAINNSRRKVREGVAAHSPECPIHLLCAVTAPGPNEY